MKIVAFTLENPKYHYLNLPEEDYFLFGEKEDRIILAVADGITRDPKGTLWLPARDNPEEMKKATDRYPRPSPARIAAETFYETFREVCKNSQ